MYITYSALFSIVPLGIAYSSWFYSENLRIKSFSDGVMCCVIVAAVIEMKLDSNSIFYCYRRKTIVPPMSSKKGNKFGYVWCLWVYLCIGWKHLDYLWT